MKMNLHRAQELIEPLKNGTAEGISQHWQARLIEALEYVIECESKHCEHGYNGICPVCDAMQTPPQQLPV